MQFTKCILTFLAVITMMICSNANNHLVGASSLPKKETSGDFHDPSRLERVVAVIYNNDVLDVSAGDGEDEAVFMYTIRSSSSPKTFIIATQLCREKLTKMLVSCPEAVLAKPSKLVAAVRSQSQWSRYINMKTWQDSAGAATITSFDRWLHDNYNKALLSKLKTQLNVSETSDVPDVPQIQHLRARVNAGEALIEQEKHSKVYLSYNHFLSSASHNGRHEAEKGCGDVTDECWQAQHFTYTSSFKHLKSPPVKHEVITGVSAIRKTQGKRFHALSHEDDEENEETNEQGEGRRSPPLPTMYNKGKYIFTPSPPSSDALSWKRGTAYYPRADIANNKEGGGDDGDDEFETNEYTARLLARISDPQGLWMMKISSSMPHDSYVNIEVGVRLEPVKMAYTVQFMMGIVFCVLFFILYFVCLLIIKYVGIQSKHRSQQEAEQSAVEEQRRNREEHDRRRAEVAAAAAGDDDAQQRPDDEELNDAQRDLFDEHSERPPLSRLQRRITAGVSNWWRNRNGAAEHEMINSEDPDADDDRAPLRQDEEQQVADPQAEERKALIEKLKAQQQQQQASTAVDVNVEDDDDIANDISTAPAEGATTTNNGESSDAPRENESVAVNVKEDDNAKKEGKKAVDSSSDEDEDICRICRCADPVEDLFAPCKCDGSSKFVHRACLKQWRETTTNPQHKTHCAECKSPYKIEVTYEHPSVVIKRALTHIAKRFLFIFGFLASLILLGYILKFLFAIITLDFPLTNINWGINHFYHWYLGMMFLLSLTLTTTATSYFIVDYPRFSQQLPILVFLATIPVIAMGYIGQFFIWIFNDTLWTHEVSFGVGLWTCLFAYNYILPSWVDSVERFVVQTSAEVADRDGPTVRRAHDEDADVEMA